MKRIVSLTLVVLMIAALFVGCGSDSVPGTYKLKKINDKSIKEFYEEIAKAAGVDLSTMGVDVNKMEDMITITLKDDGTVEMKGSFEMDEDAEDQVATGTWTQDGDKVTITVDGDAQECTFKSGELTITESGMSMTFAK